MSEKRYSPFANGSQFVDWESANCFKCAKEETCKWNQNDLTVAYAGDGTVSEECAEGIGFNTNAPFDFQAWLDGKNKENKNV